jgi:hypothetical protein
LNGAGLSPAGASSVPVLAGQAAAPSLAELAECFRKAQADFLHAASNAILHAIAAGQALIAAKELTPRGQWGKFLASCDVGERQAQRYTRLAGLAAANPTCKSDLAGLTIETAIKKLLPPKACKKAGGRAPATKTVIARTSAVDIIAAWDQAPQNERIKAINSIGVEALLAALPRDWIPEIEKRLAGPRQGSAPRAQVDPASAIPADLSIPPWLRRGSSSSAEDTVPSDTSEIGLCVPAQGKALGRA